MYKFVVLAVVVVVARAAYGEAHPASVDGYRQDYSEPTPYKFAYNIKDAYNGGSNRQEEGDGYGNVKGSYGYSNGKGIYRQVEYTADDYGFRAHVKTNEPGTDNQNPADVNIYANPIQVKYQPAPKYGGHPHQASSGYN